MSGSQKYHVETCIKTLSDVGELILFTDWLKHLVLHSPPIRSKSRNKFASANFPALCLVHVAVSALDILGLSMLMVLEHSLKNLLR